MGEDLWMVGVYGSRNPFGSGPKTGFVDQVLNPTAAATTLNEGEDLSFQDVSFDFDMTRIGCSEASYLCFDLDKNPQASVNYVFDARPDDSVTTTCVDMTDRCKGMYGEQYNKATLKKTVKYLVLIFTFLWLENLMVILK